VAQDDAEARWWTRLVAEQGHADAQFNLAASRVTGDTREEEVQHRGLAADQLTPDDRSEAHRLAREWDAAHPR